MSKHLEREIDNIKKRIMDLSTLAEEQVQRAVKALVTRDVELAQQVIQSDIEIDEAEVALEEECLKILALYQPVAIDLRFMVAVLKINNDLERIGDLAVNIAEKVVSLNAYRSHEIPFDYSPMANKTKLMLKRSLDALVNFDPEQAYRVCQSDDEIDQIHRQVYSFVERNIMHNPNRIDFYIRLLGISRGFERIADHATNIAEDVIYMIEGEIVRHRMAHYEPGLSPTTGKFSS